MDQRFFFRLLFLALCLIANWCHVDTASAPICDDVVCTKDCTLIDSAGQCPYCRCKDDKKSICSQKMDSGTGLSHHKRYYYLKGDASQGGGGWCKEFSYKGKGGNKNNFVSMDECLDFCSAEECPQLNCEHHCKEIFPEHGCPYCECEKCPKVYCPQKCSVVNPLIGCPYCECHGKKCKDLECVDGCEVDQSEPDKCPFCDCSDNRRTCRKKPERGDGKEYLIRYYHEKGQCKTFIYSGKGGNANKFRSKEECQDYCGAKSCPHLDCEHGCQPEEVYESDCPKKCVCEDKFKICRMPVMEGFGKETLKRYYYDTKYGICDHFYFKGKGGNYNNFKSQKECEEYCHQFKSSEVCSLDKDAGSCKDYLKRFFYDYEDDKCKTFTYGGCEGNGNNFETLGECQELCKNTEDACYLPKDEGPCFGKHEMYYYDSTYDECSVFMYSGCKGNRNRFDTKEECIYRCKKTTSPCEIKPDKGSCNGQHLRYYFSSEDGECKQFYYGGCYGNANNFHNKYECEDKCLKNVNVCDLDKDSGTCYGNINRYYYNKNLDECVSFLFSGCDGNGNNFDTKDACEVKCKDVKDVCQMKPEKGPCHEQKQRYFFNDYTKTCEEFYYGGCDGNENNFESKAACEKRCLKIRDVCQLTPDKGPCHGYIQKYYFNRDKKRCETFTYGGCKGNGNNFDDMEECERRCNSDSGDQCSLKPDKGPCEALIQRYFYDVTSKSCKTFIYGGCQGNSNNFEFLNDCKNTCHRRGSQVCQLPKKTGPCYGHELKYYYNTKIGRCEDFIYGGCDGNSNNFPTLEKCESTCSDFKMDVCTLPEDKGTCYESIERFFFDSSTRKCKSFYYTGCGGNSNNFFTEQECRKECASVQNDHHISGDVCYLSKDTGPCYGHIERFFFDGSSCQSFAYGGCDGNGNNFESLAACKRTCSHGSDGDSDVCKMEPSKGSCYDYKRKYFFNSISGKCETFTYSGCDGNGNNFDTERECEERCQSSSKDNDNDYDYYDYSSESGTCSLKADPGPCRGKITRYFYHDDRRKCESFFYGGCGGNANNFKSISDCQKECEPASDNVCRLPPTKGPCYSFVDRYFYSQVTDSCQKFVYGGCKGNGNNFETIYQCEKACKHLPSTNKDEEDVCQLKRDIGPCYGREPRYYYDSASGECKYFTYGGCAGNANNFLSKEKCEDTCGLPADYYDVQDPADPCSQEPDRGPCYAEDMRYYFDKTIDDCRSFVYGGCQGNENNFRTRSECQKKCGQKTKPKHPKNCYVKPDKGPCYGNIQKYYYDYGSGECRYFTYGGCDGNSNRFDTEIECLDTCAESVPEKDFNSVCHLIVDKGPCYSTLPRYFFNKVSDKCEMFLYGGCDGNGNNFKSLSDCQNTCGGGNDVKDYKPHEQKDVCSLPLDKGPCYGYLKRYHYNSGNGKCEQFTYGGCEGNKNNFKSMEACESRCQDSSEDVCDMAPFKGPCYSEIPKYYFNSNSGKCQMFIYGGCEGNSNNFDTMEQCEARCASPGGGYGQSVCSLQADKGTCYQSIPRYYHDSVTGSCKRFVYTGCGGNGNNFETREQCEKRCDVEVVDQDPCKMAPKKGSCYGRHRRYYYETKTGLCQTFIYSGCDGNSNNFETMSACENTCNLNKNTCDLPADPGPCKGNIKRFFYDSNSGTCEHFSYGGCQGNSNNFKSIESCRDECMPVTDVCQLKPEKGPCYRDVQKYFYNPASETCEMFIYGGCKGNENNFDSIQQCEEECKVETDVCKMRPEKGPCKATSNRFYFDWKSGSCERFIYGGCQGNENNFKSIEDCLYKCKGQDDVCSLGAERGPCHKRLERFFHNADSGKCEKFIYGGCKGNGNNFESIEDCRSSCGGTVPEQDRCYLPKDQGPCYKTEGRFFHNSKTGRCERFVYGGCGGNDNNFKTLSQCQSECTDYKNDDDPCSQPPEKGSCKGRENKYYFDQDSGTCERFLYSGCGGNSNNFKTTEECMAQCGESDPCQQKPDPGPCKESIKRFYFNDDKGMCDTFYYGGCGGNENRFTSKKHCQQKCMSDEKPKCPELYCDADCWESKSDDYECPTCACPDDCSLPMDEGHGHSKITKFYYDSNSNKCKKFHYRGKGGNKNSFQTLDSCSDKCEPEIPCDQCPPVKCPKNCWTLELEGYCPSCSCPNDCMLDKDTGRCNGKYERFYYNRNSGSCEKFFYGGCLGNNNHFFSKSDCESKCHGGNKKFQRQRYEL